MALNYVSDLARVGQYLRVPVHAGRVWRVLKEDSSILDQLRRGLLPLPTDQPAGAPDQLFPPARRDQPTVWEGRRVGVVATGGSGALASVVGVARALEEAGVTPSAYGLCSGSAMFGVPLAAGMSTDEVARAMLQMRPADYLDPDWGRLAAAPLRLGQGWAGLLRGEAIEGFFRELLGDITLGDLPTPVWFPVWSVELNRLRYISSIDDPDLLAARAVRMAVALPLAFEPVLYEGESYLDGGIVEILPARPFSSGDLCDVAVVINGFYRPGFVADEDPRWRDEPFSLIRISAQTRLMGHIDTARRSLADLERAADVHLLDPVPYGTVQSAGLYTEFVDRRAWTEYMRSGYEHTVTMLEEVAAQATD
ncbi:MAG: patatin-like phospholipase family protein [Actinomycetota bacterium]|nr:patatin-like phospholipase family protein [Actinomycetota bacterium]